MQIELYSIRLADKAITLEANAAAAFFRLR